MKLLIDIGNTRLKWGLTDGTEIVSGKTLCNREENFQENLLHLWKEIKAPQKIAISCVSAADIQQKVQAIAQQRWPAVQIILAKSQAQAYGVNNAYQQADRLGVDRWLCLLAARHYHQLPACIVDCGTAITVDILDDHGIHQGGVIAPGLTLMKKSLCQGTHDLEFFQIAGRPGLADNTEMAIFSGTLLSVVGLIEQLVKDRGESMNLLCTGGDADLVVRYLSDKAANVPDLVLQGLSIIAEEKS